MSRQCSGEAVASHDHAYQRPPLEPFPAERTSGCLRAGSWLAASAQVNLLPPGRVRAEVPRDAQHIGLAAAFEEGTQSGAVSVDLVTAEEVEGDAIGERVCADVDGQLPLGAELQAWRQAHGQGANGSSIWARGIHCREPISACPACSRTYARWTGLIPFATRPAQPRYWRWTPAVAVPCFSWPVSSSAPITRPLR